MQEEPKLIASLPWYDLEELRDATDSFWEMLSEDLQKEGFDRVPSSLDRDICHNEILEKSELVLSQTCGYLVAGPAKDLIRIVAVPCYDAPGCKSSDYRSFIVAKKRAGVSKRATALEDLRGSRCVVNEPLSHSGMSALRKLVARSEQDFFSEIYLSGSHVKSIEAIQAGRAEVAAIDCVTYELLRRHRPAILEDLRILERTPLAPAPPFVTSAKTSDEQLAILLRVLGSFLHCERAQKVLETMLIAGIEVRPRSAYSSMALAREEAERSGYREMAWLEDGPAGGDP